MRFDRSKRGLLAADVACFRYDGLDAHMIPLHPAPGVKATAARCSYMKLRLRRSPCNGGTVDCSVRRHQAESELNDEGAGLELSWREPVFPMVAYSAPPSPRSASADCPSTRVREAPAPGGS